MPAVVSILAVYFLVSPGTRLVKFSVVITGVALVLASGQRNPVIAISFTAMLYLWSVLSSSKRVFFVISAIPALFMSVFLQDTRLFSTFYDVIDISNINAIMFFFDTIDVSRTTYDDFVYASRSLVDGTGDLSLQLRLRKWTYAFASQYNNLHTFFIGLGTGFFAGAADSSLMRIYFETGVVGLFAWSLFFRQVFRFQSSVIAYVTICFLLNGVFIDTLYSSRVFPLYLLILGSYLGSRKIIFHAR